MQTRWGAMPQVPLSSAALPSHYPPELPTAPSRAAGRERADGYIGRTLKATYRIEALMAKGGMGAVYEARHARLGRKLAVKVLLDPEGPNDPMVAAFRREAETIAQLAHPNIVQVLDLDETDEGVPYFVMEYLQGETLAARLRREGPLPAVEALRITCDIAAGLSHVHARGIVHCDLKPANIFLERLDDERAFVKMLDFGVCRVRGPVHSSFVGAVLGTPSYMAPEQASGQGDFDHKADQFALALMAYEMFSGQSAFPTSDPAEVLRHIISTEVPPLSEAAPSIHGAFDAVLGRALSKTPELRFPSISRFARELMRAAKQAGVDPEDAWRPAACRSGRYRHAGVREERLTSRAESSAPKVRAGQSARRAATANEAGQSARRAATANEAGQSARRAATANEAGQSARRAATANDTGSTRPKRGSLQRADELWQDARRFYESEQWDEAVACAEELYELALCARDSRALRTIGARMPLLDAIFKARLGPLDGHLVEGPMTESLRDQLSASAAELLGRVRGHVRVGDLVARSGIPRRDCIRLIAGLLRRGALVRSA